MSGVPVNISVLNNDTDVDGDVLSVSAVTQGSNGSVVINADNTVTYTPSAGFSGVDQFQYTASDGHGGFASATVTVTVDTSNHAPVLDTGDLILSSPTVNEGGSVSLSGSFVDPDAGQSHTVVVNWSDGSQDTLTLAPGVFSFGPVSHTYVDDDPSKTPWDKYPINVTVTDSEGGSASAATSVTVYNVAPTVDVGPDLTVARGDIVTLTATVSDPGVRDTFTYHWTLVFTNGNTLAESFDKIFVFVAPHRGSYTVTLTVTDDDGDVGQDALVLTVVPHMSPIGGVPGASAGGKNHRSTFSFTDEHQGGCGFPSAVSNYPRDSDEESLSGMRWKSQSVRSGLDQFQWNVDEVCFDFLADRVAGVIPVEFVRREWNPANSFHGVRVV
jgi:hypothetical protein